MEKILSLRGINAAATQISNECMMKRGEEIVASEVLCCLFFWFCELKVNECHRNRGLYFQGGQMIINLLLSFTPVLQLFLIFCT